ncbi:MAG: hypothetical protein QM760_05695 [Nibricoccus sp.]
MILCLAGLWFLALGFDKFRAKLVALDEADKLDAAKAAGASEASAPVVSEKPAPPLAPVPFPLAFVIFGFVAIISAEITTEVR